MGKRTVSLVDGMGNWPATCRRMKLDHCLTALKLTQNGLKT